MAETKQPQFPSYKGDQYFDNIYGADYVPCRADQYANEMPASVDTNHDDATPGVGAYNFKGKQYDTQHDGGYGTEVSGSASVSEIGIGNNTSARGKE